jgi:hypothetical protein
LWLVVVKGTYAIGPDGRTEIASTQVPVLHEPQFRGDPETSSLLYESDMEFPKRTTDVLLTGHAYAPRGEKRRSVNVEMTVGGLRKALTVTGDRVWTSGLAGPGPGDAIPFESMPIVYERAFGGYLPVPKGTRPTEWDARNPAGVGFATNPLLILGQPIANVERLGADISNWRDRPPPAGFGPIARHWQPRASYAGTYDDDWLKRRFPLLPLDCDKRFFQCAPDDQRPKSFFSGGERVELFNLTPSGHLTFQIPSESLLFRTIIDGTIREHRGKLFAVTIEPDYPRVLMVWVTAVRCHNKKYKLQRTVILRKKRISIAERVRHSHAH